MTNPIESRVVRLPESIEIIEGDAFFELAQEISDLITQRAYELFVASGSVHGQDQENWLQAQSEVLLRVPIEVSEAENELTIRADVPGFTENDLEVRVTPRTLCISGTRPKPALEGEERLIYSERKSDRIFRLLSLASEIDTDKVNATAANGVLQIKVQKIGLGKKVPVMAKAVGA